MPNLRSVLARWVLCLVPALAAGPALAADDPPGRVARIAEVQGTVWVQEGADGEWFQAQLNRPLTGDTRISVAPDGRLELRVGSTTLRVGAATELDLTRLDDERIDAALERGSLALRVRSPEVAREIAIDTADGRFTPLRPGHFRIDRNADTSYGTAWSGELRFEARDSAMTIPQGRRGEFWREARDNATHYTWSEIERDAFSDWVARDNRGDDQAAVATRYVSPEMTGWEDLDRHGRWETTVEYGTIWVPLGVAPGWAPYRYGHWAWVRPWGWTWVDDAPWGFAPFHYGRWVHWRDRWVWTPPTERIPRPVYSPALVAWVGGRNFSISIGVGGQPGVGWVPLAPHEPYRPSYRVSPPQLRWINAVPPGHRPPPPGHLPYANLHAPGGASVVPPEVLWNRRPVAPVVAPVPQADLGRWFGDRHHRGEPAPPPRTVTVTPRPPAADLPPQQRVRPEPPAWQQPPQPPRPTERVPVRPIQPIQPPVTGPQALPPSMRPAPGERNVPHERVEPRIERGEPAPRVEVPPRALPSERAVPVERPMPPQVVRPQPQPQMPPQVQQPQPQPMPPQIVRPQPQPQPVQPPAQERRERGRDRDNDPQERGDRQRERAR